jgi:hypothetical protein
MDKLVEGLDLDDYAKKVKREELEGLGMEDEEMEGYGTPWP